MGETQDSGLDIIQGSPFRLWQGSVIADWIDEFEHVNIAHYLTICDQANWAFWNRINAPSDTMEARAGHEYIIVENHVNYVSELPLGAGISVTTQVLEADEKRVILFHHVWRDEAGEKTLSATNEVKLLAFDLNARRPMAWVGRVAERLDASLAAHAPLGRPEKAGLGIALKRR